ncbi:MAG: metallophosphoesterase family protein [Planctomycetota bacterium]|jgi:predicted phosphodiesterase
MAEQQGFAIISDVHANLQALEAVLEDIDGRGVSRIVCLGDVVGYGADPSACVELVRKRCELVLRGEHDAAMTDARLLDAVAAHGEHEALDPALARQAMEWTRDQLADEQKQYLGSLPIVDNAKHTTAVHGSLHKPELFNYVATIFDAELSFAALETHALLYGHTHVPLTFFDTKPMTYTMEAETRVAPDVKALVNVGSVGQPQDKDPRACYAVCDMDETTGGGVVYVHRVSYDVASAGKAIVEAGLPEALARRLELGK